MVYQPRGWNDNETEQLALRKATMEVFSGNKPLRMKIDGPVEISETLKLKEVITPHLCHDVRRF